MIPKRIHYAWFGGNMPDWIAKFVENWKDLLPDYEFVLWNEDKLSAIDCDFVKEALQARKWAFVADYIRLFAVYHYGGIWFDTDVELFKTVDDLLDCNCFFGKESWINSDHVFLTSHFFGAEPNNPFISEMLDYYNSKHFIDTNTGKIDQTTISNILALKALAYGFDWKAKNRDKHQILTNGIRIYPSYCFCRPMYTSMKKVYAIHRVASSWRDKTIDTKSLTDPKKLTFKVIVWRICHALGIK